MFNSVQMTKGEMLESLACQGVTPVKSRKAARNTIEYWTECGARVIRYMETDVVTIHKNGKIVLNTGGYNTVTTRARMNEFLPKNCGYVSTCKGVISYSGTPFKETLTIGARGAIYPDAKPKTHDKERQFFYALYEAYKEKRIAKRARIRRRSMDIRPS